MHDYMIVFVKMQNNVNIFTNLTEVKFNYKTLSAAKINWKKKLKQLLSGIGQLASQTPPQNLAWKTEDLKYLGISLGNKAMVNKNWKVWRKR